MSVLFSLEIGQLLDGGLFVRLEYEGFPTIECERIQVTDVAEVVGSEKLHDNGDKDPDNPDRKTTKPARFEFYTDHQIAENRGRQIEISYLMSNTTKAKIEGRFNLKGKVEHISLTPNKYGGLLTAMVTLANDNQVKDLQRRQQTVVFIGADSGRITRLGNDGITFHKDLVRMLTILSRGTTPLMLEGLAPQRIAKHHEGAPTKSAWSPDY
ncbi:hypothetical protein BGX30_004205 [Mortierella sp. GBA39]|nr:hypothetical protein BGX30_004205 [Mortierella sp. GBA39]